MVLTGYQLPTCQYGGDAGPVRHPGEQHLYAETNWEAGARHLCCSHHHLDGNGWHRPALDRLVLSFVEGVGRCDDGKS
jgi:hypothetical protein